MIGRKSSLAKSMSVQSVSETSKLNPKFLKYNARPLSLDMSLETDSSRSSAESLPSKVTVNPLPLPPRRKYKQGSERPPRPVRPKPSKYLSLDSISSSVEPKLSMEMTPILEVEKLETEVKNDNGTMDKFDTNTVIYDNVVTDRSEIEAAESDDESDGYKLTAVDVIETKATIEVLPSKRARDETNKTDSDTSKIEPAQAKVTDSKATSESKTRNIKKTESKAQGDEGLDTDQIEVAEVTATDVENISNEGLNGSSTSSTENSISTIIEVKRHRHMKIQKRRSSKSLDSSDSLMLSDSCVSQSSPKADQSDDKIVMDEENSLEKITKDVDVTHDSPTSSRSYDTLKQKSEPTTVLEAFDNSNTLERKKDTDIADSSESSNSSITVGKYSRFFTNPKVVKDLKNKISRTETHGSRTLAAEISEFLRISASKLKPPCLDQFKRNIASKRMQRDISEPNFKTPQRLIPRSPYIGPLSYTTLKRPVTVKQPPFYAWNLKSAPVCSYSMPMSASCSGINTVARDLCDQKTFKNIENSTRQIFYQTNGTSKHIGSRESLSEPIPVNPRDHRSLRASNSAPGMHSKSKPRLCVPKKVTSDSKDSQPSSNRTRMISPTSSLAQNIRELKLASKNLAKINIHLPTPHITVAKVKTQLPCEFPKLKKSKVKRMPEKVEKSPKLPFQKYVMRSRKWVSMIHGMFRKDYTDSDGSNQQVVFKQKRHTWPPRRNAAIIHTVMIHSTD